MEEGRNKGWNAVCIGKMTYIFSICCLRRPLCSLQLLQVPADSLALDTADADSSEKSIVLSFLTF